MKANLYISNFIADLSIRSTAELSILLLPSQAKSCLWEKLIDINFILPCNVLVGVLDLACRLVCQLRVFKARSLIS
jgi:hypothetical protein